MDETEHTPCEHVWIMANEKFTSEPGAYQVCWKRLRSYYCNKCLVERETIKEEWDRDAPEWWRIQ